VVPVQEQERCQNERKPQEDCDKKQCNGQSTALARLERSGDDSHHLPALAAGAGAFEPLAAGGVGVVEGAAGATGGPDGSDVGGAAGAAGRAGPGAPVGGCDVAWVGAAKPVGAGAEAAPWLGLALGCDTTASAAACGAGGANARRTPPRSNTSPGPGWSLVVGERSATCSTSLESSSRLMSLPPFADSPRRNTSRFTSLPFSVVFISNCVIHVS